jgi:glycosyltransferase involved in cell wall biosynthesis
MTAPLRVALVTTFYPPLNFGGDGQYVRRFAHALARRGCEVEIIHDADAWRVVGGKATDGPLPPVEPEPPGVTVHRLESRFPLGATLLTQQFGRPVTHGKEIAALLSRNFDVIHFHNVSLVGGPGVLALGDALKFYTAHEHWLVCPNHVLWRHNRELCVGRECLKCSVAFKRPPQLWRSTNLLEKSAAHVDAFIALSKSVADNHRAFGFETPMTLMASFLPDSEVRARPKPASKPKGGRPYFLFVGRLEIIKGLQDVIPQFDDALGADLIIAGAGAYEAELRAIANDRPNVKFIGHTGPDELGALYRGARGLIASSLCYEVFPMVALEAFREATPIVARRLGPYPQIVEESGGGLLFADAAQLREALTLLIQNETLRDRLGAAGRSAIETRWSEETAMGDYFDLIKATALARSRPQVAAKIDLLSHNSSKVRTTERV